MATQIIKGQKLDIKPNEIRYRIKNPEKYDSHSFRRKKITKGVSILVGCPQGKFSRKEKKCRVGTHIQALRFDRKIFTPSEAADWIQKHSKIGKHSER